MIQRTMHRVDNGDGWMLGLRQVFDDERQNHGLRPVAIIPGYGMNTFILGYHPTGRSVEEYLAEAGFEVWSVSLRAMDGSVSTGGRREYGMRDASLSDIGAALEHVAAHTRSSHRGGSVDLIGCSLGGTMAFVHVALLAEHRVGTIVALGAPLRWVEMNPWLRRLFSSPALARNLSIRGTRKIARLVIPLLRHLPSILGIYIHPDLVDMSDRDQLARVVEDPNPILNEEIARWLKRGDLIIDEVNITTALRPVTNPLLVITGNADGIVPVATARFVLDQVASTRKELVVVGDRVRRFAHADLYVSRFSHELVFKPIADWLAACNKCNR